MSKAYSETKLVVNVSGEWSTSEPPTICLTFPWWRSMHPLNRVILRKRKKRKKKKKWQLFCAGKLYIFFFWCFFSLYLFWNDYLQVWPTSHQGISGFLQVQVDHWYYQLETYCSVSDFLVLLCFGHSFFNLVDVSERTIDNKDTTDSRLQMF